MLPPVDVGLSLSALVQEYYSLSAPIGLVLSLEQCQQLGVDALRYYAGYGQLQIIQPPREDDDTTAPNAPVRHGDIGKVGEITTKQHAQVGSNAEVTVGEWEIIRPLFALYVERENAKALEATRGLGLDVFGRTVSEVASDIVPAEAEVQTRAFSQPILTV